MLNHNVLLPSDTKVLALFFLLAFKEGRTGGGGGGGHWHGSRTEKIEDHGSRVEKFRFPESRN